jgi:phospholipid/cholesterol/gamma-HCH transport system substrate-binding protein
MLCPNFMLTSRDAKVGAFVLIGLVFAGLVIFLIGDERHVFSSKVSFLTIFQDVEGLKAGSSVRMGGIDVGLVQSVGYAEDSGDMRLHVKFAVDKSQAARIRKDSRVKIESKGFLGDKMLTLVGGDPKLPAVPPGSHIEADNDPKDLQTALARVGPIVAKAESVLENLDSTAAHLADPVVHEKLKGSVESLHHILESIVRGPGYVARLLNDRAEADRISGMIDRLDHASVQLEQSLASVASITQRVEKGPGLIHELLYSEESAKSVQQIGHAAEEVATTLRSVRDGQGMARTLLFGDGSPDRTLAQVSQILTDAHNILADVRAGKGTLGALLTDPSVYEDLKVLLGNVERNKSLRALVRYSIEQGDTPRAPAAAPKK